MVILRLSKRELRCFPSPQKIAGHSDILMTMNRYVHAQLEKVKEVSDKVHELLAG